MVEVIWQFVVVKNLVELASGPDLRANGKGRIFVLFLPAVRYRYTNDSLLDFRLKFSPAKTKKEKQWKYTRKRNIEACSRNHCCRGKK